MESGWLPNKGTSLNTGLCGAAKSDQINKDMLDLFAPTYQNELELIGPDASWGWWGYEGDESDWVAKYYQFTTLRQTVVLFMACMAGEKF